MGLKVLNDSAQYHGYGQKSNYSKTVSAGRKRTIVASFTGGTDTAGGVLAVANPIGATVVITEVIIEVSVVATGACTVDIGPAANATTLADTLIDGLDVNAATGSFDNISDAGVSGGRDVSWTSTQFITISTASGGSAGLVGRLIINYVV